MHQAVNSKELYNNFLNSLPVGGYSWGMSSLRIERFLDDKAEKTDFYVMAEKKIKRKLGINKKTDHWNYPMLIIDHKPAEFAKLNKYTKEDIEKFEIIKPKIHKHCYLERMAAMVLLKLKPNNANHSITRNIKH